MSTHTLQAFMGSTDARSHTPSHSLSSAGLLLFLTLMERLGGPFQTASACFSCHCTLSGVTNHHQSNQAQSGPTQAPMGGVGG